MDGKLVRPHDFDVLTTPGDGVAEAMVERVAHLGFEVRVVFSMSGGETLAVQITRGRAAELELEPGQIVYVRVDPVGTSVRLPSLGVVGER